MGRTPAGQLAPGVWRVPTAPADLVAGLEHMGPPAHVDQVGGLNIRGRTGARVAVPERDAAHALGVLRDRADAQ